MSRALSLFPQVFPGCRPADAGVLSFRPSSVSVDPCRHVCRCQVMSLGGRGANADFSRRPRYGRERRGQSGGEHVSSESVPLSNSPHFRSTSLPGPRERHILELFRKVQVRLRERKLDNRAETVRPKPEGSKTVDSLLQMLRRHADDGHQPPTAPSSLQVDGDPTSKGGGGLSECGTAVGQLPFDADVDSRQLVSAHDVADDIVYSGGDPEMDAYDDDDDDDDDEMERYVDHDDGGIDDESDDGNDEDDANDDDGDGIGGDESEDDLESMTIVQLRGLAKLKALRGFSRMKKDDLVQMIRQSAS